MSLKIEKPKKPGYWKLLAVVILIAGVFLLWPYVAPRPFSPLSFEIVGFEGDAKIYDAASGSWRLPKRGEEFAASQKLKTGSDGMINFQVENEIHLRLKENSELQNEECRMSGKKEIYRLRLIEGVLLGATTREFERKQNSDSSVLKILTRDYVANIHGAIFRVQAIAQPGEGSKVGVLRGSVEVTKPFQLFPSEGVRIRGLEQSTVIDGVIQPAARVSGEEWGLMKESYELLAKTAVMEAKQIDLSKSAGSFFEKVVFDHGTFYTPKIGYAGREFFKDTDSGQVVLEAEYDVFPAGSFCGVYIKTRDFDISKYAGLSFEVRRSPEENAPDSFFIEVKSKGNVVRRFAPRNFEKDWKYMEFDFKAQKPLLVNEVVFVFTHMRVGEAKKGVLEFRRVNLIPRPETPLLPKAATQQPAVASASPKPVTPVTNTASAVPQEVPLQ